MQVINKIKSLVSATVCSVVALYWIEVFGLFVFCHCTAL